MAGHAKKSIIGVAAILAVCITGVAADSRSPVAATPANNPSLFAPLEYETGLASGLLVPGRMKVILGFTNTALA